MTNDGGNKRRVSGEEGDGCSLSKGALGGTVGAGGWPGVPLRLPLPTLPTAPPVFLAVTSAGPTGVAVVGLEHQA